MTGVHSTELVTDGSKADRHDETPAAPAMNGGRLRSTVPGREGHLSILSEGHSSRLPKRSEEKQTDAQGSQAVGAGRKAVQGACEAPGRGVVKPESRRDSSKRLQSLAQVQPEQRPSAVGSL